MSKTCVLWGGKVNEDGFEIKAGDASKGELRVSRGSVVLVLGITYWLITRKQGN